MAKTKISEWDSNPNNNTDIDSINIAEGCAPSGINNAIRELMSQVKDLYAGTSGDTLAVAGGGTGAGTAAGARTNLGLGSMATQADTSVDINGGNIDGATIATSNITVGSGKTLDVSAGTLTLANDQISGDKVEGGTINATTITTLTSTTGNITNVNATTVDSTNLEVTNIKAKDGTASATVADATGVMTIASSVLTTTDINGGTIDGTAIGSSSASTGAFTTLSASGNVTLSGATANGVFYANGSKVLTSGSALTFDGTNQFLSSSGAGIWLNSLGSYTNGMYRSGTTDELQFRAGGSTRYQIDSTGVSIWKVSGSEQMRLTSTGLGIGTSSPSAKLDVAGSAVLGSASTDTVKVNGYVGIGTAPTSSTALNLSSSALSGVSQGSIFASVTGTSEATASIVGIVGRAGTAAAAFTVTELRALEARNAVKGAGSTITNQHGVYISDQTQGTNNYGITSLVSSGTNKWNIYASGTAANYLRGNTTIGLVPYDTPTSDVNLTITGDVDQTAEVWIGTRDTSIAGGQFLGGLGFYNSDNTGIGGAYLSGIKAFAADSSGSSYLKFYSGLTNYTDDVPQFTLNTTEAVFNDPGNDYDFRVESDTNTHALFVDAGNSRVGVNTSAPVNAIHASGTDVQIIAQNTSTTTAASFVIFNSGGTTDAGFVKYAASHASSPNVLAIKNYAATGAMQFFVKNTEQVRITDDASSYLRMASGTGGIQFNGDTAAANALDDYEEGTFTPTVDGTTTAGSGTYSVQAGNYTKVGNTVFFNIRLQWTAHTGTGDMRISGLPFTTNSDNNKRNGAVTVNGQNLSMTASNKLGSYLSASSTIVSLFQSDFTSGWSGIAMDTSANLFLNGFYTV